MRVPLFSQTSVARSLHRWGALFLVLLCGATAFACSIPVFRYALERWEPAPYELLVFHRGPLSAEHQKLLATVPTNDGPLKVNAVVKTVDLSASPAAELTALWNEQKQETLPAILLRNPRGSDVEGAVWSAPLSPGAIQQVFYSPVRTRIAEQLLKGASAVWVLVESGDKAKDDAAADLLGNRVEQLQKTLKLSEIEQDDIVKHKISASADELKVAFSVLRMSRQDPAEQVLVRMLMSSEDDLEEASEPMAFPVFGRGRTLFALVGKGINQQTIEEACSFVIGPCSCVVKELNPGHDLLIAAAWGDVASAEASKDDPVEALVKTIKPGAIVPIAPGLQAESNGPRSDSAAPTNEAPGTDRRQSGRSVSSLLIGFSVVVGICGFFAVRRRRG